MKNKKEKKIPRDKVIIRTSFVGILGNLVLVAFKMVIGLLSGSIAIILDAINNLSDALSSLITIIGMKLAFRPANKEHPFGYGRIEYITTIMIALLVIFAGGSSGVESVKKLINPSEANFTIIMLVIIGVSVFVKLILGIYTKKVGSKVNSDSLKASGTDATFDAVISTATLLSAVISFFGGYNLDGILGVIISIFILKAGYDMLHETLKKLLGERQDEELTFTLKNKIMENKEVFGVYDLVLHNYGPEYMIGSAHIEVSDSMTAKDINVITRKLRKQVFIEMNIALTIGIYAVNTKKDEYKDLEVAIKRMVMVHEYILRMHAFYIDHESMIIYFDVVIDFAAKRPLEVIANLNKDLKINFPEYTFELSYDTDYSEQ